MPTTEFSNTAMGDAAEQIMKIVQKAAKLRDGHPDHLKLAVEIGDLMVVPGIQDPWYVSNDHSNPATSIEGEGKKHYNCQAPAYFNGESICQHCQCASPGQGKT
ncbi:hypothetical protein BDR07DRAFT_1384792 [Suillus spraguei]|nr:hypothetical protein BDR07DRAFT_1384792 [Suillus spraguei]